MQTNKNMESILAQLATHNGAIATRTAQPTTFRAALVAAMETRRATVGNHLLGYDPAKVGAVATIGAEAQALATALELFDAIPCDIRARQAADAYARENVETLTALLRDFHAAKLSGEAAARAKLSAEFVRLSAESLRTDLPYDTLCQIERDAANLKGDAENLTFCISTARSAIERFSNVPDAEGFQNAQSAIAAIQL